RRILRTVAEYPDGVADLRGVAGEAGPLGLPRIAEIDLPDHPVGRLDPQGRVRRGHGDGLDGALQRGLLVYRPVPAMMGERRPGLGRHRLRANTTCCNLPVECPHPPALCAVAPDPAYQPPPPPPPPPPPDPPPPENPDEEDRGGGTALANEPCVALTMPATDR